MIYSSSDRTVIKNRNNVRYYPMFIKMFKNTNINNQFISRTNRKQSIKYKKIQMIYKTALHKMMIKYLHKNNRMKHLKEFNLKNI